MAGPPIFAAFHTLTKERFGAGSERPIGIGWMSEDLHPEGVVGNAAAADAGRGAQLLDYLGSQLATLIAEVADTPLSTLRSGN